MNKKYKLNKMSLNYYEILEIPHTASHEEICQAFRTLSLENHPLRHKGKDLA